MHNFLLAGGVALVLSKTPQETIVWAGRVGRHHGMELGNTLSRGVLEPLEQVVLAKSNPGGLLRRVGLAFLWVSHCRDSHCNRRCWLLAQAADYGLSLRLYAHEGVQTGRYRLCVLRLHRSSGP
jgi:hypothetical protein